MRYYRKVIRIRAEDSPNVKLGLGQLKMNITPTNEILLPGVLTYAEYVKRRMLWDKVRQCIGLDAEFYKGLEVYLFPQEHLQRSVRLAEELSSCKRVPEAIGLDPGEGSANTCWTIVDKRGIIKQISYPTKNTSEIANRTIALIKEYKVEPESVYTDIGGGGKQHLDYLKSRGYSISGVGFGESVLQELRRRITLYEDRIEHREERAAYKNRRAQMYGMLRDRILSEEGYAIPTECTELLRQLSLIPLTYDEEGKLYILPKGKKDPNSNTKSLIDLLGNSPDEADSTVLGNYGIYDMAQLELGAF